MTGTAGMQQLSLGVTSHQRSKGAGPWLGIVLEFRSDNRLLSSLPMTDVYLPSGWPGAVAPPGSPDWTDSAVTFPDD
jgi:hypothetical protein